MTTPFGTYHEDALGWPSVEFKDLYQERCYVQMSSIVGGYPDALQRPGTSALWLGMREVTAQVMAKDAAKVGVVTDQTVGWVPFPIPPEVMVTTSMHLSREQVEGLRDRLTEWLQTGQWSRGPVEGER